MKSTLQKWLLLVPVAVSLLFMGCGSTGTKGNLSSLSLSFTAKNASQTSAKQRATTQSSHVTITEAKMLIRGVEFKSDLEGDGIPDDSLDYKAGPFVVNLNLDGSLNEVAVSEVPSGQYDEIEFDVHKPEDNETPPDPDFKIGDSGDERFSIIIKGTYNGQDFTYRSRENMKQEIELSPPLTIDEDTENINVTMRVDLSQWFVDENGNPIDPTNTNMRNEIDDSIERSFEAFEDNDEDGEED